MQRKEGVTVFYSLACDLHCEGTALGQLLFKSTDQRSWCHVSVGETDCTLYRQQTTSCLTKNINVI